MGKQRTEMGASLRNLFLTRGGTSGLLSTRGRTRNIHHCSSLLQPRLSSSAKGAVLCPPRPLEMGGAATAGNRRWNRTGTAGNRRCGSTYCWKGRRWGNRYSLEKQEMEGIAGKAGDEGTEQVFLERQEMWKQILLERQEMEGAGIAGNRR